MSRIQNTWLSMLFAFCLIVCSGCAGAGGQHVLTASDQHVKQTQSYLDQTLPDCTPDVCFIIPCDLCSVPIPILYDAYYLRSGGGGGSGGAPPPPAPPPLGGTAAGCDADESLCYFIPGDDTNALYYSSGEGGVYTIDPSGCQKTGSGFVSTTDGKVCSTWQIYFYNNQYTGQGPNPQPLTPPGIIDAISMHIATANSQYPNGTNGQVLNGGHLYLMFWSNHIPILAIPLQGGRDGTKLRPMPYGQNIILDPHFFFALARVQAPSLAATLEYKTSQYNAHTPGDAAPTYDYANLNSNSWMDGLLLSSGISVGTIDQFVAKLTGASAGTLYPYGYGTGNSLVYLF